MILFLSPYAKYIDASSVPEVHDAAEAIGGGAIAVGTIAKWMGVTFGAIGAGEAYSRYEDEINEAFYDYISAPSRASDEMMKVARVNAENGNYKLIPLYGNNVCTMTSDQTMEWVLSGGAASAAASLVDSLTDLYVQFAPWLLESFDDFMTDVLSGDVYIQGFSDTLDIVDTFSDYESIKTVNGEYSVSAHASYLGSLHTTNDSWFEDFYYGTTVNKPFAVVSSDRNCRLYQWSGTGYRTLSFRY